MAKKTVVIGFVGTQLDRGEGEDRWGRWRPTVSIGMQEDLQVDRLELLHDEAGEETAKRIAADFRLVSPETLVNLHGIPARDPWDFESVYESLFDFASRYPFDPDREDYLVHISTGTHVMQICLFLLTESRHIPGRLLQTGYRDRRDAKGTYDVIDLDLSRYDRIAARFELEAKEGAAFLKSGIETRNPAYNALVDRIARVAERSDDPVLLTGPTGVGKTRLARLIYEWKRKKRRVTGPFVEVNCATLKGAAAMSALFGHEKGAYTGAVSKREGLMRAADGGMLFLDEVGELGPDEQAMLLRAIEEKRFYPLGSDSESRSDFQLICGTNRGLGRMVREGKFRADLLARVSLWTFRIPGLAERPEDIAPNVDYEVARVSEKYGRKVRFSREALGLFLRKAVSPEAAWRGNFRDLSGAVTRMAVLSEGGRITESVVEAEWKRLRDGWREADGGDSKDDGDSALVRSVLGARAEETDPFDIPQLALVIRTCRAEPTLSAAGRTLFRESMKKRKSSNDSDRLRKYLARFGLTWDEVREGGEKEGA